MTIDNAAVDEINSSTPIHCDTKAFPILASLSSGELIYLRTLTMGFHVRRGEHVIKEGEQNHYLYLLKEGLLKVEKIYHDRLYSLAYITPGQMFGESSFLYGTLVGATITTVENSIIYQIHSHEMHAILDRNQQFKRSVQQISEYRLASSALAINHVFHGLPAAAREIIVYNARFVKLNKGEFLYRDGDAINQFMCVLISGAAEVYTNHPEHPTQYISLGTVGAGDEVGEIPLITGEPHTANVRATESLQLIMISTESLLAFCDRYSAFADTLNESIDNKLQKREELIAQQRTLHEINL
ncbi:MAG: cyclic nucleotide-binding domain-containing protein [Mariprofundaceae bacterium]|nr:cyclic nucleotide-binding domain-containing protein [Mariprofundaceae bacterium]